MSDFRTFVRGYYEKFAEIQRSFDKSGLEAILGVLLGVAEADGTLWVAGNGGSASISDHSACDLSKGGHPDARSPLRSISLASNAAMLTAIANDLSFDQIFCKQLEYCLRPGDAVLLVSASGDSENVVEACRYAKQRGVPTIAFVGFKGGRLKALADHVVHVEVENYGMVEDTHQSLMHVFSQYLAAREERLRS